MKRRGLMAGVGAMLCVAIIAVATFWPGEREPVYQGKKLSAEPDSIDRALDWFKERSGAAAKNGGHTPERVVEAGVRRF